jgi:hypothetical protein
MLSARSRMCCPTGMRAMRYFMVRSLETSTRTHSRTLKCSGKGGELVEALFAFDVLAVPALRLDIW